ncbi:MAG: tetratricopeptide repeat protein [Ignavibacteria bacterium]|nr:tetratricopeptide repeat protein [Ignavibacteria bacterium]
MINNRYQIIKKLGEGRGEVFLVKDTFKFDKLVALKILKKENLEPNEILAFKNEFKVLKLLEHPNIIKVFDIGNVISSDNANLINTFFYTSEYIEGKNLLSYFELNQLDTFYDILEQICLALFYCHQFGILHYDIKPENILVVEDVSANQTSIKLIDFGFSIDSIDNIRGTPDYISPEIIRGDEVDWRTDLYSLGATLFHVLNGVPPFHADDRIELLKKHLTDKPMWIRNEIPETLKKITLKLLEKDVNDRYKNSLEIIKDFPSQKIKPFKNEWYLPKAFIERDDTIEKLRSFVLKEKLMHGTFLIVGEEGAGKSTLIEHFTSELEFLDKEIFKFSISEKSNLAYDFWLRFVREAITRIGQSDSKLGLRNSFERLIEILRGRNLEQSSIENLKAELAQAFINFASTKELVVFIDDFANMDEQSKDFLTYILPSLVEKKARFVFTLHPEFLKENFLNDLKFDEEIKLIQFGKAQVEKLLKIYFKWQFPHEKVSQLIVDYTNLLPRSINDFISLMFLESILYYDEDGFHLRDSEYELKKLEKSFAKIYETKFCGLSPLQQKILSFLSCYPGMTLFEHLQELLGISEERMRNEIDYLKASQLIKVDEQNKTLSFIQSKFKDYIHDIFDDKYKTHLKIAEQFEKNNFEDSLIASQYESAGYTDKAFEYYLSSASKAESLFAFSLMRDHLNKALSFAKTNEQLVRVKKLLAQCYYQLKDFKNAAKYLTELIELNKLEKKEKFKYYLWLGITYRRLGDIEASLKYFEMSKLYAENELEKSNIELEQITLDSSTGKYIEVKKRCEDFLQNYEKIIDSRTRAIILNDLGIANFLEGNVSLSLNYFNHSLQLYDEIKDVVKVSQVSMNIGNVLNVKGDHSSALQYWENSLKLNESFGNIVQRARILNNIGISFYDRLQFDTALKYYNEARALFERIGDNLGLGLTYYNISESALPMCEYTLALKSIEQSLELATRINDVEGIAQALFQIGFIYFSLNNIKSLIEYSTKLSEFIEQNNLTASLNNSLYLLSLVDIVNRKFENAVVKLKECVGLYGEVDNKIFKIRCQIDLMNIYDYQGKYAEVTNIFQSLCSENDFSGNSYMKAEALLILGSMCKKPGVNLPKKAHEYFLESLNLIENLPINEISWQAEFALGEEYLSKGAVQKGYEKLNLAKLLIDYIAEKIEDIELRKMYLADPKRARVLNKIQKNLN